MATAERVARVEGVEGVASVERVERVPLAVPMRSGCHAGGSSPATVGGGGCNHRWRISPACLLLPAYSVTAHSVTGLAVGHLRTTALPTYYGAPYLLRRYLLTTALPTYYGATYLLRRYLPRGKHAADRWAARGGTSSTRREAPAPGRRPATDGLGLGFGSLRLRARVRVRVGSKLG